MNIDNAILTAATCLLKPGCPNLTEAALRDALEKIEHPIMDISVPRKKPITRKEAAQLLSVSLNTLNRYVNSGLLRKIKVGPRHVLIDPDSITAILQEGGAPCNG